MCYNFNLLKKHNFYGDFTEACIEAEKSFLISYSSTAILTRRALELAVKWVFSYDQDLKVPYQDNLSTLIHDYTFRSVIDSSLFPKLRYIQKLGNAAVHSNIKVERSEAIQALSNLYDFTSWIDYSYSDEYIDLKFDESLLQDGQQKKVAQKELQDLFEQLGAKDRKLSEVVEENQKLRQQMTAKREENEKTRDYTSDNLSEYKTRKKYIDLELKLAGWELGKDCLEEVEVHGMPSSSGVGYVDYILYDDSHRAVAVVEAKKTSVDPRVGKQQAKLYADCLEQKHGLRPVIFYTNGYEYYMWDDTEYPERRIAGIYTKEDLDWLIYSRSNRKSLETISIKDEITNRAYQKMAIQAVCDTFGRKHRKALLVMATGSGKTRTSISLVDVLMKRGWVKNILFLADRTALVKQAKKNFKALLPNVTLCNLLDSKDNPESRMVFSTYPTMMNAIDDSKTKDGRQLFTIGHFDLIIVDESHRSIYKKYQAIFDYFDSALVGLTATPKNEIDKNTYTVFELENNVPTFAYELGEAIEAGYLNPFHTIETKVKFIEEGVHYDQLSEEEKEQFEETFDDGVLDRSSEELNSFLFNDNTIDRVLHDLMTNGIKIEGDDKLGKTIIFAKNKKHAQFIIKRFNILYPEYKDGFMKDIYTDIKYVDSIIDDFSTKDKLPQIAVSVDMLDTGIDIPEILNLVFFKKIRSKTKFWQMIGRGTRLCPDLFGVGIDKTDFRIFDYCSNFEFFREEKNGKEGKLAKSLTEKLFLVKANIAKELQSIQFQTEQYIEHRNSLVKDELVNVQTIDENRFDARMKVEYIHKYINAENWKLLTDNDIRDIADHLAYLVQPIDDDELAKRFDYLMLSIEYSDLKDLQAAKLKNRVLATSYSLTLLGTIPQVKAQEEIIFKVQTDEFWESPSIFEYEEVRIALRDLIKFIPTGQKKIYYTNFEDEILSVEQKAGEYSVNSFKSYRMKVNSYLKEHQDDMVVYKLRNNKELSIHDIKHLEDILWHEIGTKEDYKSEFGDEPLVKLVSRIVGLEPVAANEVFSQFLSDESLDSSQMDFVQLIVKYVIKNGIMDKTVLNEHPFNKYGSVVELFDGKIDIVKGIVGRIDELNGRVEIG